MLKRDEVMEEVFLRGTIRKIIKSVKNKRTLEEAQVEESLRGIVRKMILLEKTPVADEAPHEKTGINKLRQSLKKIVPVIRDDYLSLTTDPAQRKSYMAHLINGISNLLAPIEANIDAPEAHDAHTGGDPELEEDLAVDVGQPEGEEFIDFDGSDAILPGEEEAEVEEPVDGDESMLDTGIESEEHDETGRNFALATFKQIQKVIVDDYGMLPNDEDRELYHDYLKTNILLWRDKFEETLSTDLPEPTTPEYEQEIGSVGNQAPIMEVSDNILLDISNII
tara:strand:- start:665 stop:1504 length:840 start_codon:yes stop_codon:yes gene_type:complete